MFQAYVIILQKKKSKLLRCLVSEKCLETEVSIYSFYYGIEKILQLSLSHL